MKYELLNSSTLAIHSFNDASVWEFCLTQGLLTRWTRKSVHRNQIKDILSEPPQLGFYRALTDNDRGGHGREWIDRRLHEAKNHTRRVTWKEIENGVRIIVEGRFAPPVLAWGVDTTTIYTFQDGKLHIRVKGNPHGLLLPKTFARIGLTLGLRHQDRLSWWGRGPGESYCDKKQSQLFGSWSFPSVGDLWTDYEFPQDGGNRTDVRTVEFIGRGDDTIFRADFGDLEGASFSVSPYTTQDIDECTHPYELHKRRRNDTILRLDWAHHGLGTGSCGPWTLPEYQLTTDKDFDFEIVLD